MAKNYAIMRIQKLTTNNHFAKAINHNSRGYANTPGVDKEGVCLTYGPAQSYKVIKENLELRNKIIEDATGHAVKKNRVRGFEVLFAVNKDFMSNDLKRDEYFKNAENWIKETFGEDNYLNHSIHMDESGAPHMHAMVTAIATDEKDGCRKYMASDWVSDRKSLTALQDSWHSKVAHMGLERGQKAFYTHDKHKTKQEYLKLLESDLKNVSQMNKSDRDLLAVKGLRQLKKEQELEKKLSGGGKSKEQNKDLLKDLDSKIVEEILSQEPLSSTQFSTAEIDDILEDLGLGR